MFSWCASRDECTRDVAVVPPTNNSGVWFLPPTTLSVSANMRCEAMVSISACVTMTMTMTHSEKPVQQSLEAWPYRRERRGHDPAKKSLLKLTGLHVHTVDDSVQYIEHKRKTRRDKINKGCCWNKFSEFKSLESSDSEQRVDGDQGDPGRTRKTREINATAPLLNLTPQNSSRTINNSLSLQMPKFFVLV